MKKVLQFISLCSFLILGSCSSTSNGQMDPNAALGGVIGAVQSVSSLTTVAQSLRSGLLQLTSKLSSYASYTASQFQSPTNAQAVSTAIAAVASALSGSSVPSVVAEADAVSTGLPYSLTQTQMFYVSPQQSAPASTWSVMIFPNVLTRMIHIQALYTAAIVNTVSQNIQFMNPMQISTLGTIVQAQISNLSSLPV